jgi:hypothetical protein
LTAPLTTAYAGHGDSTEENIKGVLDQFLPPALGLVLIPERVPRLQAGLKKAIAWLEGEVGKAGTIPVPDLVAALLQRNDPEVIKADENRTGPDDLALVLLYDPANEDDVALAKAAIEAGIKVVDLCSAGDDVLLADAEVKFEEEVPLPDEPAEEEPPFVPDPPKGEAAAAEHPVTSAIRNATEAAHAAVANHALPGVSVTVTLSPDAINEIARAIVAAMGHQAAAVINPIAEAAAPAEGGTVSHMRGVAADGEQPKDTKAYYYDGEKGTYRPARGMARKNEEKVFLTEADVEQIKAGGLLA